MHRLRRQSFQLTESTTEYHLSQTPSLMVLARLAATAGYNSNVFLHCLFGVMSQNVQMRGHKLLYRLEAISERIPYTTST